MKKMDEETKAEVKRINLKEHHHIPVLEAFPRTDCHGWKVWCAWCRAWHLHGTGLGHRTAHCTIATSPFHQTGYFMMTTDGLNRIKRNG